MPSFKLPTRSGVHRLACLSLYRALLSAHSRLPASNPEFNSLREVIQTQFRNKRSLKSPTQISKSLKAGYEALDLLDSCSRGNSESIHKLETLHQEAQALSDKIRSERKALAALSPPEDTTSPRVVRKAEVKRFNREVVPHPDVEPILSRPRPKVSGKRRVPVLVAVRGEIPFLRIKKPQPRSLSRVINRKLERRWNRILLRQRLQEELDMARAEDSWDEIVGETVTESWRDPLLESLKEVKNKIYMSDVENARVAKEMWEVVLKERELAEKEKRERIALKRQRLSARREAKKASADTDSGNHENAVADGSHKDSEHTTGAVRGPTIAQKFFQAFLPRK